MTTDQNGHSHPPVEIKGGSVTLPIVRLRSVDMVAVAAQLRRSVEQAPEFFRRAPVVIDVSCLPEEAEVNLAYLLGQLQQLGMIPVALRGGGPALRELASAQRLALLADAPVPETGTARSRIPETKSPPASAPPPPAKALLVTQPVRSGQRIYAKGSDLVVLAAVGHGAEVMADGHIHIYGTLRGRALAGVRGDRECRIFCRDLQAELVSIAGHYRISEDLDETVRGRTVQVYMRDTALIIEAF